MAGSGQRPRSAARKARTIAAAGREATPRYTGALAKAARILGALEDAPWLGASELATHIGVDRSTTHRLAHAMVDLGWLRQDPQTRRYRLGLRLWELGARAVADLEVRSVALPRMRDVVAQTGESCDLAVLDGADIVYIEKVDGTREVRAYTWIGQRVPAHAVAMGKVLLSFLTPDERRRRLPDPLPRYTDLTVASFAELEARCADVARLGYAVNLGERNPEAGGLAVPVFNRVGECVAALGINVPSARMSPDYVGSLAPLLVATGTAVSRELGGVGAAAPSGSA